MTIGISKIMVGIDGSEESVNAADYAIAIAKRYNAELIAVNVLTFDIGYAYSSPGVESPPLTIREIIMLAEDGVKKWFNEIKEKADQSSIHVKDNYRKKLRTMKKMNLNLTRNFKSKCDSKIPIFMIMKNRWMHNLVC
jgi:nucleotide-binding universal stress UspA family protein